MRKLVFFILTVAVLGIPTFSQADIVVLDFEDLYSTPHALYQPIPANYEGFEWSGYAFSTQKDFRWEYWAENTGYQFGTIGKVSLFNANEQNISMSRTETFDFLGAFITAAWNTGQDVTVEGWADGVRKYSVSITTSYNGPFWFDFNFRDINTVWFLPGNSGANAGLGGFGHFIVIDNINQPSSVPLPFSILLLGSGLLRLANYRRQKLSASI